MNKNIIKLTTIFNKLIKYEQKEMLPLTDDEKVLHHSQKVCFLREKEFCTDKTNKEEYKLRCKVKFFVILLVKTAVLLIVYAICVIKYLKLYQ